MSAAEEHIPNSRYSRRGFLKRAGAGAGAVALSGAVGAVTAPRAMAARSATVSTSPTTFGRIFPNLPPFAGQVTRSELRSQISESRVDCLTRRTI